MSDEVPIAVLLLVCLLSMIGPLNIGPIILREGMRMTHYSSVAALVLVLVVSPALVAQTEPSTSNAIIREAVIAVLNAQRDAWNRGDIEGYMDGYDRSDSIVFLSGDSVSRGWRTVHDRYKNNYNTREKMGALTFSEIEVNAIGNDTAVMIGRWHLKRANDEPHGRFTLIFKRTSAGWRIVHDHTSSA